jgi:hypothetical protein
MILDTQSRRSRLWLVLYSLVADVHKPIVSIKLALNDVVQDKAEHRRYKLMKHLENVKPEYGLFIPQLCFA